ncbi:MULTISPECIES: glycosyltransferase family 2 protein [Chryseobacterium]|uniref:N-acetylglucosaminyl-diphospho-decaprenol L-rhamnosyltransferase n=1 Tax=Chryseobacterium camelliae TaxID=1265445 RepID=A0ABU0TM25_9FLAO|nr:MULTISPECIES: glycosyltransferase family 2 protein [Chryseobacterium]MDT3408864.1 N-acetylglucosaminyl-diphospho-decaprenol L-rhamnosyltransferase [Pseudacidovorax intermedius]MDQ1097278.1 N-acetylglucosaminyl-diphospho-decaprenol L-rhamnosyltransferase [Chryseobacterium camelliae]MDQ1101211.1 N-acetylglucosaminyl-diphospho-decaprenol L-rhamnosyltransferase [Chryseobacterium sp. SORGH_AS_1048]MDR6084657.1 N-acetylglucosaminyl-diphospho-decaprenol L-rhamnosyltransferase [Chryseobacterium sp. 
MKLSIVIVNYNVTRLLKNCLQSIQKYLIDTPYEVIVVDNASTDSSWRQLMDEFTRFRFIASESNEGFARANNKAIRKADGEYLLILNPDTELEGFYMQDILDFADSKADFGCLGVRMHDAAGNFLPESKRSVPDMINSFEKLFVGFRKNETKSYYRNDIGEYENAEVEVITGAFMLIRKEVYEQVGGLDEAYFMYGEDIDLCYTLLQKGYRNYYYGQASILHHKGESTVKDEVYLNRFYGAMQIFIHKYYKTSKPMQYSFLKAGLRLRHTIEKIKLK